MKKIKNLFVLVLSLLIGVSTVACDKTPDNLGAVVAPPTISPEQSGGSSSIPEDANSFIVENGSSSYKIVIPAQPSNIASFAANELETFFAEATGIHLPIISDSGLAYTADSKYLSIGNTTILEQAEVDKEQNLGHSGVQIETVGKSVFMVGGDTDYGALYGVYDFLYEALNFEYFGNECYTLDKNVTDLKLLNFDNYVSIPSFQRRMAGSGINSTNIVEMYRFREEQYHTSFFAQINAMPWHNSLEYVKGKDAGHEAYWYNSLGNQLCYTAHGLEDEYDAMQQACLESLIQMVIDYPHLNDATLTISDVTSFCSCDACVANVNKYKCESASIILFCNDLRARLEDWFNTEEGAPHKREYTLSFFAYFATTNPPAEYNSATGKWEGIDGIKCNDGVGVFYAPIYMDFTRSIYSPENKTYLDALYGWSAISSKVYLWTYDWNFRSYWTIYDTFDTLSDLYKCIASVENDYIFQECGHYQPEGASCYENLKMYLNSKLAWDCNADVNQLIEKFFTNFYGPVATEMKEIFDSFRVHSAYLKKNHADYGGEFSCEIALYDTRWYPKQLLIKWNNDYQAIRDKLETIKDSNPKQYEQVYKRVVIEQQSPIYILLSLYGDTVEENSAKVLREYFKESVELWGQSKGEAGDPMSMSFEKIGIK